MTRLIVGALVLHLLLHPSFASPPLHRVTAVIASDTSAVFHQLQSILRAEYEHVFGARAADVAVATGVNVTHEVALTVVSLNDVIVNQS